MFIGSSEYDSRLVWVIVIFFRSLAEPVTIRIFHLMKNVTDKVIMSMIGTTNEIIFLMIIFSPFNGDTPLSHLGRLASETKYTCLSFVRLTSRA